MATEAPATAEFAELLDRLRSNPDQECVIRRQLLQDSNIDYEQLAREAGRQASQAEEIYPSTHPNIGLRDVVIHFSAQEV